MSQDSDTPKSGSFTALPENPENDYEVDGIKHRLVYMQGPPSRYEASDADLRIHALSNAAGVLRFSGRDEEQAETVVATAEKFYTFLKGAES